MNSIEVLAFAGVVIAFAGFMRGFSGFGGPLIIVTALAFTMEPVVFVPMVLAVDMVGSVGLLRPAWGVARRRPVVAALIGSLITLPIGSYVLLVGDPGALVRVIHGFIVVAALILLLGWRTKCSLTKVQMFGAGALNGFVVGFCTLATGMIPFMFAGPEPAAEARANFIIWSWIVSVSVMIAYAVQGGITQTVLEYTAMFAPLYLVGVLLGGRLFGRIDDRLFRKILLSLLLGFALFGLIR